VPIGLGALPIDATPRLAAEPASIERPEKVKGSRTVDVQRRLPERVEVASYFVVSEAPANAAKHARAEPP
jgi:signal transduction histidine kinase